MFIQYSISYKFIFSFKYFSNLFKFLLNIILSTIFIIKKIINVYPIVVITIPSLNITNTPHSIIIIDNKKLKNPTPLSI